MSESIMNKKVLIISFSPGGTTKKILSAILKGMKMPEIWQDITKHKERTKLLNMGYSIPEDIGFVLIGSPVYAGDIPSVVIKVLEKISGSNIPVATVVNYGNRDFGNALNRLSTLLTEKNFNLTGAAAFISKHSFSSRFPIAIDRPDKKDLETAIQFGKGLKENLSNSNYKLRNSLPGKKELLVSLLPSRGPLPEFCSFKCSSCGLCVKHCPMAILSIDTMQYYSSDAKKMCLGCMSCVNVCKREARTFTVPGPADFFLQRFFKTAMSVRNEPLIILK